MFQKEKINVSVLSLSVLAFFLTSIVAVNASNLRNELFNKNPDNSVVKASYSKTYQVVEQDDDLYEYASGSIRFGEQTQFIGGGGSYTAFRFQNVDIPRGATITSAYLEVYGLGAWRQLDFNIHGELMGTSEPFTSVNPPSARRLTTQSVTHSSNVSWNDQEWVRFEDVSSIINHLVNRQYWDSGNSLSLILVGTGGEYSRKQIYTVGFGSQYAPRLVVNYEYGSDTSTPAPTSTPNSQGGDVTLTISSSSDDVYEQADGTLQTSVTNQNIGGGGSYTGFRFQNVDIPLGAQINSAYLEVYARSGWIPMEFDIYGELVGDSAPFSASSPPSARRLTTQVVSHSSNTQWSDGEWVRFEDVSSIINHLVNREYWAQGNDLSLILVGKGGEFGRQSFYSYDANPNTAPRLVINYVGGGTPPTSNDPPPDQTASSDYGTFVVLSAAYQADFYSSARITEATYCGVQMEDIAKITCPFDFGCPESRYTKDAQTVETWAAVGVPADNNCTVTVRFSDDPGERLFSTTVYNGVDQNNPVNYASFSVIGSSGSGQGDSFFNTFDFNGVQNSVQICGLSSKPVGLNNINGYRYLGAFGGYIEHNLTVGSNLVHRFFRSPIRRTAGWPVGARFYTYETTPISGNCIDMNVTPIYDENSPVVPTPIPPPLSTPIPTPPPTLPPTNTPVPTPTNTPTPAPTTPPYRDACWESVTPKWDSTNTQITSASWPNGCGINYTGDENCTSQILPLTASELQEYRAWYFDTDPYKGGYGCFKNGLNVTYYDGTNFDTVVRRRIDRTIEFDFGRTSPVYGLDEETFSARWIGEVQAPQTGTYEFATRSDDGVRLWVNDQLIINNWSNHAATVNTGYISLIGGQRYQIKIEYYENYIDAVIELSWRLPGSTVSTIIPSNYLYPTGGSLACGQTCTTDQDCRNPSTAGIETWCNPDSKICESLSCEPGKTIAGANCTCDAVRTCGQSCGASVGLCASGSTCGFITEQNQCLDAEGNTALQFCLPNNPQGGYSTAVCSGIAARYLIGPSGETGNQLVQQDVYAACGL